MEALPSRSAAFAFFVEQELHLLRRRPRPRRGAARPRRPGREVFSRGTDPRRRSALPGDDNTPSADDGDRARPLRAGVYDLRRRLGRGLLPKPAGLSPRRTFRVQFRGDLYAFGAAAPDHRPIADRLSAFPAAGAARLRRTQLGNLSERDRSRRLGLLRDDRRTRPLRPDAAAGRQVAGQATGAGRLPENGHLIPDRQFDERPARLAGRLRVPVLALPPQRVPRRRRIRAVRAGDAGAGCGPRHHQRSPQYAAGAGPGLAAPAPGDVPGSAARRSGCRRTPCGTDRPADAPGPRNHGARPAPAELPAQRQRRRLHPAGV